MERQELVSATLEDLFPGHYTEFIKEDHSYWVAFAQGEGPTADLSENNWIKYRTKYPKRSGMVTWFKIKVTYIRAGVAFYQLEDFHQANETYFLFGSIMAGHLIPTQINVEELTKFWKEVMGFKSADFSKTVWNNYNDSIKIYTI